MVARAKPADTAVPVCGIDCVAGQGANGVHRPAGAGLGLLAGSSSNASHPSAAVDDELAGGGWFGGVRRSLSAARAVEKVIWARCREMRPILSKAITAKVKRCLK